MKTDSCIYSLLHPLRGRGIVAPSKIMSDLYNVCVCVCVCARVCVNIQERKEMHTNIKYKHKDINKHTRTYVHTHAHEKSTNKPKSPHPQAVSVRVDPEKEEANMQCTCGSLSQHERWQYLHQRGSLPAPFNVPWSSLHQPCSGLSHADHKYANL